MKKEDFIEKTKEKLSGNSKQIKLIDFIKQIILQVIKILIKLVIMYS